MAADRDDMYPRALLGLNGCAQSRVATSACMHDMTRPVAGQCKDRDRYITALSKVASVEPFLRR